MLDELEEDMDAAHDKMNFVMGKIGKLLKTKSECGYLFSPNGLAFEAPL